MAITNSAPLTTLERGFGQAASQTDTSRSVSGVVSSAVSWGAIAAGAAAGASLSLILLILGVGLGLSSVSPWAREGISAASFGVSTIAWLTLTQLLSSAMGDAAEVGRIFTNVSRSEPLPPEDIRYVGQLVAQRTGVSQQDAEKRVTEVYARAQSKLNEAEAAAKDTADKARKASAYAALWVFVSLLSGAFVASLAATYGGRQRDA